jgi:DNA (cytosine-5)-methyltransferase 1
MAKFISLFAGCGGIDLGMEQAGHECVAQVEWDKNAAGVLKHRWPNVPLFCDVSKVSADDLPDADFITYGFPCQDLSVAGKREGLDGKRSGLFYEATRLIRELRSRGCGLRFALAENVRGLMSADDGLALARCIRELLDCGASEVGFRILDSQYFGVAQRRKRVFIVSDFGGESCDEILAITESLPGHPAPSREAGKGTAGDATKGVGEGGHKLELPEVCATITGELAKHTNNQMVQNAESFFIPKVQGEQKETYCLQGGGETSQSSQGSGVNKDVAFTLNGLDKHGVAYGQEGIAFEPKSLDGPPRVTGDIKKVVSPSLNCMTGGGREPAVVSWNGDTTPKASEDVSVTLRSQQGGEGVGVAHVAPTLSASNNPSRSPQSSEVTAQVKAVHDATLTVRRLTPIECERLQGFPDNWTSEKMELILEGNEWKATGKVVKQADGPRYKAMGNAVTVNVAEWIGKQIGKVLNETK